MKKTSGEFFVTPHALDKYNEHYPNSGYGELLRDLRDGAEIEEAMALTLTGRGKKHEGPQTVFVLSAERIGIFALVDSSRVDGFQQTVVTYIRLGDPQKKFAQKNWPMTAMP